MTLRTLTAAVLAAPLLMTAPALAQSIGPGEGPADISADRSELFDAQGLVVYSGDVNVVRGGVRLRADRLEAYYVRRETGGRELRRIVAEGEVFYVTEAEIARGDRGTYDLVNDVIELTGSVVLTQGCNVSTGEHLYAELATGVARLDGGENSNDRVRSVFFTDDDAATAQTPQDCPAPVIPGDGPRPYEAPEG
jgi:lipopolysaccharide export system protein LptA